MPIKRKNLTERDKLTIATQALERIVSPNNYIKLKMEGTKIDGVMANMLSNDPNYLKEIAARAIKQIKGDRDYLK